MRVELLFWDADPEYMTARQRLVEVLIEDAFETPIQMIAVATEQDAEFLALPGSPTIRIDGADIDPGAPVLRGSTCGPTPQTTQALAAPASPLSAVQGHDQARRGTRPRLGHGRLDPSHPTDARAGR
jgi:hypothetical protein